MRGVLARTIATVAVASAVLASTEAVGQNCYGQDFARPLVAVAPPIEQREVLILIDETAPYPADMFQHVLGRIVPLESPGTRITVGSFSYYSGYTRPTIHMSFFFEPDFPTILGSRVSRSRLNRLIPCLLEGRLRGVTQVRTELSLRFAAAHPMLEHSDIMNSLRLFGDHIRASRARTRTIVLVSDMLENSTTTSFYTHGVFRPINPTVEIEKARRAGVIADLSGASVYVVGMGLPSERGGASRPSQNMRRLEQFWTMYFADARAGEVIMGSPFLLQQIP